MQGSKGGELVIPNGTYTGGTVAASRSDWLVLRAESPGGVTVDLSSTGLQLDDPTSKIVFVGFRFVKGMVRLAGVSDVHFWYCDFSFTPEEWNRQFQATGESSKGGRATRADRERAVEKMKNPYPTALRIRQGVDDTSRENQRIGVFGSDLHDLGDDGIIFGFTRGFRVEGVNIWNIEEKGYDPGRQNGNGGDWWHGDSIQTVGASRDVAVSDSWLGQKVQWGSEDRDVVSSSLRRIWIAGSRTYAQITGVKPGGRILNNVEDSIRAFGNKDRFRIDFVDGDQKAVWADQHYQAGRFEMRASNIDTSVPAGITVSNGALADVNQVRQHRDNPANRWRAAHPLGSYRGYLGL